MEGRREEGTDVRMKVMKNECREGRVRERKEGGNRTLKKEEEGR